MNNHDMEEEVTKPNSGLIMLVITGGLTLFFGLTFIASTFWGTYAQANHLIYQENTAVLLLLGSIIAGSCSALGFAYTIVR